MTNPQRALLAARISVDTDESTSIARQLEKLDAWAQQHSYAVAGVVEDRSVSGSIDLPDRPSMGPWLTEEGREEWDVLAVTTQDRLSRDDLHFMAFVKNVLDWGKLLVVLDDPSFDISTETGRLIAYAKATQAAAELRKIRQRADARSYLRRNGLFAGGTTPCGYLYEESPDGKHYVLIPEPTYSKLVKEMSERVRAGVSTNQLARELNAKGVLTWRDHLRSPAGAEDQAQRRKGAHRGAGDQVEPSGSAAHPQAPFLRWLPGLQGRAVRGRRRQPDHGHRVSDPHPRRVASHGAGSHLPWTVEHPAHQRSIAAHGYWLLR